MNTNGQNPGPLRRGRRSGLCYRRMVNYLLVPKSVSQGLATLGKEIKFELLPEGRRVTTPIHILQQGIQRFRLSWLTLLLVGVQPGLWSLRGRAVSGVVEGYLKCFTWWLLALFPRGMEEGMAGRPSGGELYWFVREVWIRNLTCLWGIMEPNSGVLPHRLHCLLTHW